MRKKEYLLRRVTEMEAERQSFITHYQELSEYIQPRRGRFFEQDRNRGDRRHRSIINSRATQALRIATAGLFAGTMSPSYPWFKLETLDPGLMRRPDVIEWLHLAEILLRQISYSSNLYNMAPVMFSELLLFGTGAMSHLDDFENVARFYTHTAGSYMIAQNDEFDVDTFALVGERTVRQMVQQFGIENVSTNVANMYRSGDLEKWFPVYQLVEPNEDYNETKVESKYKRFRSTWFEPGDELDNKVLKVEGFDEFPLNVVRWGLANEDVYGTDCPGMIALGDTKGMQIEEKRKAQGLDKMVTPVLKGPPSMNNSAIRRQNVPGGFIADDGTGEKLSPAYNVNLPFAELQNDIQRVEARINEAFYVDLFMAITSMQGVQPRNQLELSQRNQEALLQLGPPLNRIHRECQTKIVERMFKQALRSNLLPPPPEELGNAAINIRFVSSLALAQQQAEVGVLERFVFFAQSVQQSHPESAMKVNADEVLNQYAQFTGVNPGVVVPDEVVQAARQQQAEQQQAAAQRQAEMENAAAASQAANAVSQLENTGG